MSSLSLSYNILFGIIQGILLLILAPLVSGLCRKIVARLQQRIGPPITQPFRDIRKLWSKESESRPKVHTWIYTATPVFFLSCVIFLASITPVFINLSNPLADIILIIYIFALIRFLLSICAFDTGSPMAVAGAWRENTIAVIIEILMLSALFIPALECGSTNLYIMVEYVYKNWSTLWSRPSYITGALIFFVCMLIESGTLPFDIAEAEQEIQEGLLQEYSGRLYAVMKFSHMIKNLVILTIFIDVYMPFGIALVPILPDILVGTLAYLAKLLVLTIVISLIMISKARLRLVDLHKSLTFLFIFTIFAFVCYFIGW